MVTLHYIYDPLCGWCYGAAPLVKVARNLIAVQAHAGGMMAGPSRQAVTSALRQFVMSHDQRIAQVSGQPFGQAYFEGLLRDNTAVFDSGPPITAVLAADELAGPDQPGTGLDLLARLQQAHYVEGQRIADVSVLTTLAAELGLDAEGFRSAYARLQGAATQAHIARSRALLARVGGQGFPTFALEADGQFQLLDIAPYLGQPEAWRQWLTQQLGQPHEAAQTDVAPFCGLDGCTP